MVRDHEVVGSNPTIETITGCGAAWLAHLTGGQGVAGSNPVIPTSGESDVQLVLRIREQALLVGTTYYRCDAAMKYVDGEFCWPEKFYKWVIRLFDGRYVWFYQMDVREVRVNGLDVEPWEIRDPFPPKLSVTLGLADEANEHDY